MICIPLSSLNKKKKEERGKGEGRGGKEGGKRTMESKRPLIWESSDSEDSLSCWREREAAGNFLTYTLQISGTSFAWPDS